MNNPPLIMPETDEYESIEIENEVIPKEIIDEKEYELKLNNITYILQIQIDLNYIYFKLYENKEKGPFYYYNKFDFNNITNSLKLFPDIYNNLNKVLDLLNIAYNNNKLQLSKMGNNINIIIKLINGYIEIDCPIKLNKTQIDIDKKIENIIKDIKNLKNKNNILLTYNKLLKLEEILMNNENKNLKN